MEDIRDNVVDIVLLERIVLDKLFEIHEYERPTDRRTDRQANTGYTVSTTFEVPKNDIIEIIIFNKFM